jgi:AcrR family transcriptional regulator
MSEFDATSTAPVVRAFTGTPATSGRRRREITSDRIVDAAAQLFSERGYNASPVADLAAAAGISRATFYIHFPTRGDLILALMRRLRPTLLASILRLDDLPPTAAAVRGWLDELADLWSVHLGIFNALHEALVSEPAVGIEWVDLVTDAATSMRRTVARNAAVVGEEHAVQAIYTMLLGTDHVIQMASFARRTEELGPTLDVLAQQWVTAALVLHPDQAGTAPATPPP